MQPRTRQPGRRVDKRNRHLARLDRVVRREGESMELRITTGSSNTVSRRANVRGIVRTLGVEQLIAGITQTKYLLVLSPNDLRRAKYRSGSPAATPINTGLGHRPATDLSLPTTSDVVFFRGSQKSISKVDVIYSGDQAVRVELQVTG